MSITVLKNYVPQPWKNGQGSTTQIAIHPSGSRFPSDDFEWRLSSAEVRASGPFSSFPGYDRHLLIIDGAQGAELTHPREARSGALSRKLTYSFRGELDTECRLTEGAFVDLGLMVRRGDKSSSLERVDLSKQGTWAISWEKRSHILVYCVEGGAEAQVSIHGREPVSFKRGETLYLSPLDETSLSCEVVVKAVGPGTVLAVATIQG